MAGETTRLTIELEVLLRNLQRTLRGLDQIQKRLQSIGAVTGRATSQSLSRQVAVEKRAAEALQRQRSAALIAEERKRLAAVESLQRQRSATILQQERRLSAAVESLQRQRSSALIAQEKQLESLRLRTRQQAARSQAQEQRRQQAAAISLQRQRSAALIAEQRRVAAEQRRQEAETVRQAARAQREGVIASRRAAREQLAEQRRAARATAQAEREKQRELARAPQLDAHVRAFRAAQQAAQQFNRTLTGLGNSLRSVGQGLASFGATLSIAVSAPLAALGTGVVDAAVRMDSLRRGLNTIAGSSEEAAKQLERLTEIAKLPGIGFEEAVQGSIRLQAVGFSAQEAERALRQFSNAIALTGGGREDLANVTVQLGQMAAQSKVLAQDLKPIISSAPVVAQVMREAFGTVRSEEIQELGVSSKEFIDTLIAGMERLPRAAAGARNSFENFRDEMFRAAAVVGTALLPALTRLAEVAGPIITKLAETFAALPVPLQVVAVGFAALVAALGPAALAIGVLITGVGRLLVGFAQLNATGILPTIANLRALTTGTLGAAAAQRTLASTTALVAGGVGILLTALTAAVTAFAVYQAFQKDSVALSREQADALTDEIAGLKQQAKFLDGLQLGVERTANEQERLLEIYSGLNREAKVRVTGISEEEKRLAGLREEIAKLIALREQERIQAAASVVGELANNLLKIQANERERDSLARRIQVNSELVEVLEREEHINGFVRRSLAERAIAANTVEEAIGGLKTETQNLSERQDALIASGKELNDLAKDQVAIIQALERQTGLTARELLVVAQNMGRFRGDVAAIIPILERYVAVTNAATGATDAFSRALQQQERDLLRSGQEADDEQKRRQAGIQAAAANAREASDSFAGAVKLMNAFIAAQPQLRADIAREAQIAGKTFDDFVQGTLERAFGRGGGRDRGERGLRNARQQLVDALAEVALAEKDRLVQIEQDGNEAQLKAAEVSQRLRIISYREFLELRAQLTADSIDKEIQQQAELVAAIKKRQAELLDEARKPGLQSDERARREAQAAQKQEEAIKAETRLILLQRQRERITVELQQLLAESQQQQIADVAQLEIRYAELQGRIEDALKAATIEEFRESLEQLGRAQEFLNRQLKTATGERKQQLETERQINQRQIEGIQNQIRARDVLAELAAAEKLVENAKERQRRLEADLQFQVQFRGLTEEESIRRRLEGEQRLAASLELSKAIVEDLRQRLLELGITPPPELQKFLDNLTSELLGLAELPFAEQFRLAEKEFNRINDERLRRIADIERAVNNRNLSEAEGLLIIRRINGEYVGDLERQLQLLREIAARSNDASLQRQAQSAEEVVKDANDRLADFIRQLRSTSIDALRSSFIEFFQSLRDNTVSAQEKLLNLIDSVVARINEVIAENLFDELMKSIFGDGTEDGGIIAGIKRLFGFGGNESVKATVADVAGKATESTAATAAATALTTGATAAATALTTGGATAATTLTTAITAAATTFAAAVTAAGAAFAASVGAASVAGGAGGGLAGLVSGFAATGLYPAVPGGVYRVVEGGYPEAVLTTDPKHYTRQLAILKAYIRETRGLGGRVKGFAAGGMITPGEVFSGIQPAPMALSSGLGDMPISTPSSSLKLRQILVDKRSVKDWINTPEGEQAVIDVLEKNRPTLRRLTN